jgi:hypothetical protein
MRNQISFRHVRAFDELTEGGLDCYRFWRDVNILCENLCEKNFPKSAKIGKNRKECERLYLTISVAYNDLRRLGNSEVVTENPRVGSSILSLGIMNHHSDQGIRDAALIPFSFDFHDCA